MTALLAIDGLTLENQQQQPLVKSLSLELAAGQTVALIGESGSGKSLTALACLGLLPGGVTQTAGTIKLDGHELTTQSDHAWQAMRGKNMAMIFQEPMSALNPLHKIGDQIAEMFRHSPDYRDKTRRLNRVRALLSEVGLQLLHNRLNAYPHELSGGQRQRVLIAMAIANHPKLLIADEPTTALDAQLQQDILNLLQSLQEKHQMGLLFISHHLPSVRHIADEVLVMRQGEVVERGDAQRMTRKPSHPYSQSLMDAVPPRVKAKRGKAKPFLECKNLQVHFPIGKGWLGKPKHIVEAVKGVSLTLHKGEVVGLVGESGSGKSSFAKAIASMHPYQGEMQWHSDEPNPHLRSQYMFQDPFGSLNPRMSVHESIAEGIRTHRLAADRDEERAQVHSLLKEVELPEDMERRYPHELSGGQRQRVALARALAVQPDCLLLDEPTSALDASTQRQVLELLQRLQQERELSCLLITHDLQVVRAMAHRTYVMHQGVIVEHGKTSELFKNPQHDYTKLLVEKVN